MVPAEQARAMVDAWRQGTQKAWDAWFGAFGPAAPAEGAAAVRSQPATDTWTEALAKALRAWVDQAVPLASSFMDRLLPDPAPLAAMFDASVAAWQAMGRQAPAPPAPPGLLGSFGESLGRLPSPFDAVKDALKPPEIGAVAGDLAELWTMYLETLKRLSRPWFEAVAGQDSREVVAHDSGHHSGLVRFSELSWDMFERTFGRLLQSPSIGFTRELNEKLLGAFSAWLEFRRANVEYQVAVSAALTRSTTTFLQELASLARKGEPIGSLRDLLGLWGDTLDGVLIESFRSEEYARIQGNVVRAAMAYRIREREAMDVLLKIGHVPTRRELDEVARHLYELRKEVREVRRTASQAEPQGKPEAKAKAKAEAKPEPKAEAKPEPKAEAKPEPKAEAKPEPRAEAKPEPRAEPQAKPEPKAEAKPEPRAEAKQEPRAEAKPKPPSAAGPRTAASGAKTEQKPSARPPTGRGTGHRAESGKDQS